MLRKVTSALRAFTYIIWLIRRAYGTSHVFPNILMSSIRFNNLPHYRLLTRVLDVHIGARSRSGKRVMHDAPALKLPLILILYSHHPPSCVQNENIY